jgi:hypothetical protein
MGVVASEQQNNWSIRKLKEKRKKDRIIDNIIKFGIERNAQCQI